MSRGPELKIQDKIVAYLNKRRILNWRISSTNMSNFPDLLALYKGRFVTFEVKSDANAKVRQGQLNCIDKIQEHGGYGYVVWSVEQVKDCLDSIE